MKLSKNRMYYILLAICILLQNRFFHIVNASMTMTVGLMVSILFLFLVALGDRYNRYCKYSYRYLLLVFLVIVIPQTMYAFSQGETVEGYIDVIRALLNIFLIVPAIKYCHRKGEITSLFDMISLMTSITLGMLLVNCFFLNNFGIQFFPFDYYVKPAITRGNWVRIYLISDFTGIIAVYSFCRFIKDMSKNKAHFIAFIICLSASVYIEQSRMQYMAIIASCVLAYSQMLEKRKKILLYVLALIFALFSLLGDWFSSFFEMFSVSNKGLGISTLIRIHEYGFATDLIKVHPIFGTGMTSQYLFNVVHQGYAFEFNHTDIGLLGCITYIGLIGTVVLFIAPVARFITTLNILSKKSKSSFEYMVLFGALCFVIITAMTTLITDSSRIFAWPFVFAMFEYYRYECMGDCLNETK